VLTTDRSHACLRHRRRIGPGVFVVRWMVIVDAWRPPPFAKARGCNRGGGYIGLGRHRFAPSWGWRSAGGDGTAYFARVGGTLNVGFFVRCIPKPWCVDLRERGAERLRCEVQLSGRNMTAARH